MRIFWEAFWEASESNQTGLSSLAFEFAPPLAGAASVIVLSLQ
jgi:hypothetical protein